MSCLLQTAIRDAYPDRMMLNIPIFPSPKVSNVIVEPYNTVLAMMNLIDNVDNVMCMDNEALYERCYRNLKIPSPTYADLNHLVATAVSGMTSCMRFPGQLNSDLRKLAVNLVTFPRVHFFTTSVSPITSRGSSLHCSVITPEAHILEL